MRRIYGVALALLLSGCRRDDAAPAERLEGGSAAADSAQARSAVEQYLAALARRDYPRAATLFAGEWREPATGIYGNLPDTLTLAGFLQGNCERGFYVCRLRLGHVSRVIFTHPDTIELVVSYLDSLGRPYAWGPCCGDTGAASTDARFVTVARDSGYAVLNLPHYVP